MQTVNPNSFNDLFIAMVGILRSIISLTLFTTEVIKRTILLLLLLLLRST